MVKCDGAHLAPPSFFRSALSSRRASEVFASVCRRPARTGAPLWVDNFLWRKQSMKHVRGVLAKDRSTLLRKPPTAGSWLWVATGRDPVWGTLQAQALASSAVAAALTSAALKFCHKHSRDLSFELKSRHLRTRTSRGTFPPGSAAILHCCILVQAGGGTCLTKTALVWRKIQKHALCCRS